MPAGAARPPRRRGFACPACLTPTRMAYTKRPAADLVVRGRRCPECGLRLITEERVARARRPVPA